MASKIKIHFGDYFMDTNLPNSFDEFISMCYEFDNFDFNEYTFIFSNFLIKFYFDNVNEYQKVLSELTRRNYGSKITIVKRNQNDKQTLNNGNNYSNLKFYQNNNFNLQNNKNDKNEIEQNKIKKLEEDINKTEKEKINLLNKLNDLKQENKKLINNLNDNKTI